jgi:DNA invertase Pin-like site-specific DNA recombinase
MNNGRRAAIYTRISNDKEGGGLGVQRQEEDCRTLAKDLGWVVVEVYQDNDISAYQRKKARKGYNAMLKALEAGEVNAVLAWHTDRLHRRTAELETFINVIEATGAAVQTVRGGVLDLASPDGRMVAKFHGAIAQREVEHGRDRVARAKEQAAAAGKYRGGPRPFGYEQDGLTLRVQEADAVRWASQQLIAGQSLRSIAREMTSRGIRTTQGKLPIDEINLRNILLRPRNAGLMEQRGAVVGKGNWDPILDADAWRAVVAILKDPARVKTTGSEPKWLGSNLYLCGTCCGKVRASMSSDGRRVYRCLVGRHVSRDQEGTDEVVLATVAEVLRTSDVLTIVGIKSDKDVSALRDEANVLRARRDQLALDYAEGLLDGQQLKTASRILDDKLADIDSQITDAASSSGMADLAASPDPGQLFLNASLARKRAIINSVAVVTLTPAKKGRPKGWTPGQPYFDPKTIDIRAKES